jgi:UDP-N-acetylmuramoyl-tripeptide--D-alanyl-D-alanine ligase
VESISLSAAEIAAAIGGRLLTGDSARRVERWSIDTRTLRPGDLFVAIRGDRFDGHAFVAAALAAGAAGAVVTATPALPEAGKAGPAPLLIEVADTTRALQDGAREIRRRSGAKVVAITGSAGKTTTKELTAEFLSGTRTVFRNRGNLNNHIGLPLSLLELRTRPDVAVVELGMNHPGEIRTLVGVAEPDVRVWTNVGDAHLGFFPSADEIANAKAEILEQARPQDLLVSNADDERIQSRAQWFGGRILTFGLSDQADVHASAVQHRGLEGMSALVASPAGTFEIDTPLLGTGNLLNILAAAAVAIDMGVPTDEIAARAASTKPASRRGELLRLPGGVTLIDDSYNSSPAALKRSLETMAAAKGSARKVAVLGEMLELGEHSTQLHQESGLAAAAAGLEVLITVGGVAAEWMADAARAGGVPTVVHAAHSDEATRVALQRVRPGDLVLVKGSRGIRTDIVVERLKAEFA